MGNVVEFKNETMIHETENIEIKLSRAQPQVENPIEIERCRYLQWPCRVKTLQHKKHMQGHKLMTKKCCTRLNTNAKLIVQLGNNM